MAQSQGSRKTYPKLDFNFTFHDLKAKGISDLEGTLSENRQFQGIKHGANSEV